MTNHVEPERPLLAQSRHPNKTEIMNKLDGRLKSWHVNTLIRRALEESDNDDKYWDFVRELHERGTYEVFKEAKKLCHSKLTKNKMLGINILAQIGAGMDVRFGNRPYRMKSLNILRIFLDAKVKPKILESTLVAIGHLNISNIESKDRKLISLLADHQSKNVRLGVVWALMNQEDKYSIATIIRLTRDKSPMVRDWAVFALGDQIDSDTPAIRKALVDRLGDPHWDTRCEAMRGLAIRKDKRVLKVLRKELMKPNTTSMVFEAAAEFDDKSLLALFDTHIASIDDQTNSGWIDDVRYWRNELQSSS